MSEIQYPQWRIGTWWEMELRQQANWIRVPTKLWVGPVKLTFSVVEREEGNFVVQIQYPERPENISSKQVTMVVNQNDYQFVKGTIQIGEKQIPMGTDLIAQIFQQHPPGTDLSGQRSEERIRRLEEDLVLRTYTTRTRQGGIRVSSPDLPYHLRIRDANYTLETINWG